MPASDLVRTLELAAKLYESAELIGIRLDSLHAEVHDRNAEPPYVAATTLTPSIHVSPETVTYRIKYEVEANSDDRLAFKVECTFEIGFSHALEDIPSDVATAFGNVLVLSMLQPYLRELVHRMSSDLGFPELVLDNLDAKDLLTFLRDHEIQKVTPDQPF
jgi:preprotein translocase subunit SecB